MTQPRLELTEAPACSHCGARMRLFGIEPHHTFDRTDLRTYVCTQCDGVRTEVVPLPPLAVAHGPQGIA